MTQEPEANPAARKRTRKTRPYPVHTLEDALTISAAIYDENAARPYERIRLAKALGTTPTSSGFMQKLNSASMYGLTEGGYRDDTIALTPLGESIHGADDEAGRLQPVLKAALRPDLFRRFYELLEGKRLPEDSNAVSILERELEVDPDLADECLRIIKQNGMTAGLFVDINGSHYVSLGTPRAAPDDEKAPPVNGRVRAEPVAADEPEQRDSSPETPSDGPRPIFIGHAGSPDVADFIAGILASFDVPYRVVESDYDAVRPVSDRVSDQLRACGGVVLVFAAPTDPQWAGRREEKRRDKLMYQLGAASVLHGDRVLTLEEHGPGDGGWPSGFAALTFRRDRLDELGLSFLSELHKRGLIAVSAGSAAHQSSRSPKSP